jgi:hypothetical protein
VGSRDLVGVEHAGGVGHQVGAAVSGAPRLVGDGPARVAVVVADHEPVPVGQHPAEALLPPEHRGADAHDEQDRRVGRVPEGLGTQLDLVGLDHSLSHGLLLGRSRTRRVGASTIPRRGEDDQADAVIPTAPATRTRSACGASAPSRPCAASEPTTRITGGELALDTLRLQTLGDSDSVEVGDVWDLITPVVDLGADE